MNSQSQRDTANLWLEFHRRGFDSAAVDTGYCLDAPEGMPAGSVCELTGLDGARYGTAVRSWVFREAFTR